MENTIALKNNKSRVSRLAKEWGAFGLKVLIGLFFLFPIFVMMSWSLRPDAELVQYGATLFPRTWTLEYYKWCVDNLHLFRYMLNSFIQFGIIFLGHILFATFASFAFVFCNFKGKKFVFSIILMAQAIPGEVTVVANYMTVQRLRLIDTFAALCLPSVVSGMSIFMMRQHFLSLPKELKEASEIDGCSDIRFIFSILIPISIPSFAALGITDFIHVYNSWLWPLLVTNSDKMRTVQIGLAQAMTGEVYDEYGRVLAAATIVILPTIFVFIIGQEYLIRGMISGSVKG